MSLKKVRSCKACDLNQNGCVIENKEGYRKGGCGAWIERKSEGDI